MDSEAAVVSFGPAPLTGAPLTVSLSLFFMLCRTHRPVIQVHTQTLCDHGFPHTKNNVTFIINDTTTESVNRLLNVLQGHCCHWRMQLCVRVNAWRWDCLGIDSLRNILQPTLKPISLPSASLVAMTRRAEQCLIIYGHI